MGNAPSEIDDAGKRNRITPNMSRQNTQITVRPVDEGMEMDFVDERSMSHSPSQVFAERAWRDTPDGRTPSPNPMSNGGNYKKKKAIDRLNQVMDYMSAKRSNTVLSNPASTRSTKDIVYELEEEFSDDINKKLGKNQEEKYNVIENFFERMGSTVSAGEESSERDPSPDYYGGSKKRPLGDDPHPVSIGEKKKGLPDDPVDEKKNRLATSQLNREKPTVQFATMKFHKKCVYSQTHFLYTRDESLLPDMPPPHPPYTRKSEIFDARQYRRVDKKALKVRKAIINGMLSELVTYLTERYRDDISKLRALYVWLTSQNLRKLKLPLKPAREGHVLHYLEKLKKKRGNYAQLFSHLCNLAGLPCVVIHGYLKGSTYEIGQTLSKDTHYGEWNAVLINNNWRFINAYWGSCAVGTETDSDIAMYRLDENFFMPDPDQLAYTHFPEEQKWQLLEPSMSMFIFEKRAFLKERFFELDMRVLSHPDCEIKVQNGEEEILFGMNPARAPNLDFMCFIFLKEEKDYRILYDDENRYQHDFLYRPNDDSLSIKIRFPKKGTYRVEIVGKDNSIIDEGYDYDWIAVYKATVVNGCKKYVAFPKAADAGWGNSPILEQIGLESANYEQRRAILTAEEGMCTIGYEIKTPEARDLMLSYKMINVNSGLDDVTMESDDFTMEDGKFQVHINLPPGDESAFCLFAQIDDPEYGSIEKNLCNYLIISTPLKELDKQEKQAVKSVEEVLDDAIHFKQLEMLERAVDLVETKRATRHMYAKVMEAKDTIERLKSISKMMHKVLSLDQRTIAEIRGYSNPSPEIHAVMKATLLLLGHYEEETREWRSVQAILGKTGRNSLKRKINMFDINHCKLDIALGAQKLLGDMKLQDILNQSCGAATFFEWVHFTANEVSLRRPDEKLRAVPLISLAAVRFKANNKDLDKVRQMAQADIDNAIYSKQNAALAPPPTYQNSLPTNKPYFKEINEVDEEPDLPSPFAKSLKGPKKGGPKEDLERFGAVGGEDYVTINDGDLASGSQTVEAVVENSYPQRGGNRGKGRVPSKPVVTGPKTQKPTVKAKIEQEKSNPASASKNIPFSPSFEKAIEKNLEVDRPTPQYTKDETSPTAPQSPPNADDEGGLQLPGGDDSYVKIWLNK